MCGYKNSRFLSQIQLNRILLSNLAQYITKLICLEFGSPHELHKIMFKQFPGSTIDMPKHALGTTPHAFNILCMNTGVVGVDEILLMDDDIMRVYTTNIFNIIVCWPSVRNNVHTWKYPLLNNRF